MGERSGRSSDTARLEGGNVDDDIMEDAAEAAVEAEAAAAAAARAKKLLVPLLATDIDSLADVPLLRNCCFC